jgi:transposase InsO family protein
VGGRGRARSRELAILDENLPESASVARPTGNAVVERFIETLKLELIRTRDCEAAEEIQEAISAWLHVYNHP